MSDPSCGDALVVHDVELGFGERCGDLVFHHLHPGSVSDNRAVGLFDRADPPDIAAHRASRISVPDRRASFPDFRT